MDINSIIHVAADAGRIILENGGEIYRVEDTIVRICNEYDIKHADSFVLPTGIMISATNEYGQTISLVKRIKYRTVNLEKIALVNDISRNIKTRGYTIEELKCELNKIDDLKNYKDNLIILSSCFAAGFFTLLFGGNFYDFLVSLFIGLLIKKTSMFLNKSKINEFFIYIVGGMIAAICALIIVSLVKSTHIDKIIIGSIMLLVPGLAITNAIRDTISGDIVAGISRAVEAFLTAVAIAMGSGLIFKIWFTFFGGVIL